MTKEHLQIALPWHALGHGNLGIDALTRSNIAIVESAAQRVGVTVDFTTLCADVCPDPATVPANVEIGPMPSLKQMLRGNSEFLAFLRKADLVIDIGEGDSWADIYGGTRFLFHAGTKIAAHLLGKPLVLAPQTIGPFDNILRRRAAVAIMNRARAVFARDDLSFRFLEDKAIKAEIDEFIDVAFRLPYDRQDRAQDRTQVGINVSGLLYQGGYTGRNEFGLTIDYKELTHRLIEHWQGVGYEVHLLPHVVGRAGNDGDLAVVPALLDRYPDLVMPTVFASASEAKSYISGLDFVTGGRMHACIGAFSSHTPVVPIAYSRKFNGLFGTLDYPHFVDGKTASTDEAFATITEACEKRAELSNAMVRGSKIADSRLDAYEDTLARIIGEIAR
ncbi:polysaccharide pyruvyl transferase family protein [Qipengyuania sp. GH38]|uniref:polysaccharide pyruvyl transferase family protein n=1 Tax=Qipengyuania intermedia TaxID=2867244 RepID=UPI001C8795CE|nr:polysaccharide pyruvyl transferase family protein [Qipengyuania intermedia]MBX7515100.1 polysaccharide pyruvyl transferase family protein [Qipengyuania intermedia]